MSIYDNIAYGPRTHGIKSRVQLDEIVETSLKRAAIWEETKDNLKNLRCPCPAVSSSVSASRVRFARRPGGAADGRADLCT